MINLILLTCLFSQIVPFSEEEEKILLPIKDPLKEAQEEMEFATKKLEIFDIKQARENQKKTIEALENAIKIHERNNQNQNSGSGESSKMPSRSSRQSSKQRINQKMIGNSSGGSGSGVSGSANYSNSIKNRMGLETKIWGSLNKKEEKEEKISLLKEEFLPFYSSEIESYYKEISDNKTKAR